MILLNWCLRIYLWVGLVSISMCSVSLLYCKPLPGRRRKWHNTAREGKTWQRTNIHSTAFNIHCYWPIFQSCLPYHQPPITHPIQNETYTFQCSRPLWILFWYSHICSHHFLLMRVLRVFDSQSESSFLLTFVPCLLLPSSHFHFHFCRAFFDFFPKNFLFILFFLFFFDPFKFFF